MNIKQTLRSAALGAALLAAGASASYGASGETDVTVTMPNIIILDYFDDIHITFTEVDEARLHDSANYTVSAASWADGSYNGDNELTTSNLISSTATGLDGADMTLTLKNTWAVRGLSSDGTATVSITGPTEFVNGASSIAVSDVQIQTASNEAAASISDVPLNGVPKAKATLGDILMTLNMTDTTLAGDYTGTITITATAN